MTDTKYNLFRNNICSAVTSSVYNGWEPEALDSLSSSDRTIYYDSNIAFTSGDKSIVSGTNGDGSLLAVPDLYGTLKGLNTRINTVNETLVNNYAEAGHTHDGYAEAGHNHDDKYSDINHNHDERYSEVSHNHDDKYAEVGHNHDTKYAEAGHNHDERYSLASHNHDGYAEAGHNHDTKYSDINHNHDERYSLASHNHDERYSGVSHTHDAKYADKSHNHDTKYSDINHNHDDKYAEKSHTHNTINNALTVDGTLTAKSSIHAKYNIRFGENLDNGARGVIGYAARWSDGTPVPDPYIQIGQYLNDTRLHIHDSGNVAVSKNLNVWNDKFKVEQNQTIINNKLVLNSALESSDSLDIGGNVDVGGEIHANVIKSNDGIFQYNSGTNWDGYVLFQTKHDTGGSIYFRQYDTAGNERNEVTLMDASGNTSFPKNLSVGGALSATSIESNRITANGIDVSTKITQMEAILQNHYQALLQLCQNHGMIDGDASDGSNITATEGTVSIPSTVEMYQDLYYLRYELALASKVKTLPCFFRLHYHSDAALGHVGMSTSSASDNVFIYADFIPQSIKGKFTFTGPCRDYGENTGFNIDVHTRNFIVHTPEMRLETDFKYFGWQIYHDVDTNVDGDEGDSGPHYIFRPDKTKTGHDYAYVRLAYYHNGSSATERGWTSSPDNIGMLIGMEGAFTLTWEPDF